MWHRSSTNLLLRTVQHNLHCKCWLHQLLHSYRRSSICLRFAILRRPCLETYNIRCSAPPTQDSTKSRPSRGLPASTQVLQVEPRKEKAYMRLRDHQFQSDTPTWPKGHHMAFHHQNSFDCTLNLQSFHIACSRCRSSIRAAPLVQHN